jgi:hypothetical protein
MAFGITTIPSDVLQAILDRCRGFDTLRMVATGDKRLGMSIRAMRHPSLEFQPYQPISWPLLVGHLPKLTSFTLRYPRERALMSLKGFTLDLLPSSLKRLDLRFFDAELCFIASDKPRTYVQIDKLFPQLEYLRLFGMPALGDGFLATLEPLPLVSLLLPSAAYIDHISGAKLPETLTEINLMLCECDDASWIHSLPLLKKLSTQMSHTVLRRAMRMDSCLETLVNARHASFQGEDEWRTEHLPISLVKLALGSGFVHCEQPDQIPKQFVPSSLVRLTSLTCTLLSGHHNAKFHNLDWPPMLQKLALINHTFDVGDILRLPQDSLTYLKASMSSDCLLHLPKNLKTLKIERGDVHASHAFQLPRGLRHLEILSGVVSPKCFVLLPRSLETLLIKVLNPVLPEQIGELPFGLTNLNLGMVTGMEAAKIPVNLPPQLKQLSIENPRLTEAHLTDLPRSLTHLDFLGMSGWTATSLIRSIPAYLLLDSLHVVGTTDWTDKHIEQLPSTLVSLKIGSSPSLVGHSLSRLSNLTTLSMSAPNFAPDAVVSLPRGLTHLNFGRSNLLTSACFGFLPPNLTAIQLNMKSTVKTADLRNYPRFCVHVRDGNSRPHMH